MKEAKNQPKNYLTSINRLKVDEKEYELLKSICHSSKNLYNLALYYVRQHFFKEKKFLGYNQLYHQIKNEEAYRDMHSQCGQQTLKKVDQDMKSFFGGIEKAKESGNKKRVRLPRYKDKEGFFNLYFQKDSFIIRGEKVFLSLPKKIKKELNSKFLELQLPQHLINKKIIELQIVPCYEGRFFQIAYVYEDNEAYPQIEVDEERFLGVDLGIDNLMTMVDSVTDRAMIIKGHQIKSINQYYNKEVARLKSIAKKRNKKEKTKKILNIVRKRNSRIKDIFHKVSYRVVDYCKREKISEIIIGYNENWKQEVDLGNKTNQSFVQIPHRKLIDYIRYKAHKYGIQVTVREESYTSKCDALALEEIMKHENYLGKRKKRGFFQSSEGKLLNADVNGALNIIRKCKGDFVDFWILQLTCSGRVFRPRTWHATSRSFVLT